MYSYSNRMYIPANANTALIKIILPFHQFITIVNSILIWIQFQQTTIEKNANSRIHLACKGQNIIF